MPETSLDLLLKIAGHESVQLEPGQDTLLAELLESGQLRRIETSKHQLLEARYNSLQETHQFFLEAKACVDRLQRRVTPRSRLADFFPTGGSTKIPADDPEVVRVFELLGILGLQIREVEHPEQVPERIERIRDRLQVDGRDCLDRLASTDREIDALQKSAPPGTLIDALGHFALTETGEQALPEARTMEELESAFHAVSGPRKHKITDYAHFREDPANLLAFVMEFQTEEEKASSVVAEFEALSDAFERLVPFAEINSARIKNAFLIRLIRAYRETPKRPYLWCNRERLQGLMNRMKSLVPHSLLASGWHLPYAVDLFIANPGAGDPAEQEQDRTRLFEAIQSTLANQFQEIRIGDGQFTRLALALMHAARNKNFSPSILLDRFVKVAIDAAYEGTVKAPRDLGDRGTKLLFGFHLAHAAGFAKDKVGAWSDRYAEIELAFDVEGRTRRAPAQVILHVLASLDRLERAGCPIPLQAYAETFFRIRRKLHHHKGIARAFGTEQAFADDQAFLAANLTAHAIFGNSLATNPAKRVPDVGMAGLYEPQARFAAPILGQPFGSLLLA
ncbi:MAG: hypothetical protein WAT51_07745 [Holophaga sp.]